MKAKEKVKFENSLWNIKISLLYVPQYLILIVFKFFYLFTTYSKLTEEDKS